MTNLANSTHSAVPTEPAGHDVLVIGGGYAGLSAALTLARARRSVLVIDAGAPRNAPAAHSHGFLTRDGVPPREMLELARTEVRGYGAQIMDDTVTALTRLDEHTLQVTTATGRQLRARRVLLAAGLVDELPAVPGLAALWGTSVIHCPYCFGWDVRDQSLGILATGPRAVHQALLWRQWSADITLFLHSSELSEAEQDRLRGLGVDVVAGTVTGVETADGDLRAVLLEGGGRVERRFLVVPVRMQARGSLAEALGARITELPQGFGSQLEVDAVGRTSVAGLWAAGNASDVGAGTLQAAAQGMGVAAAINGELIEEDTRGA